MMVLYADHQWVARRQKHHCLYALAYMLIYEFITTRADDLDVFIVHKHFAILHALLRLYALLLYLLEFYSLSL